MHFISSSGHNVKLFGFSSPHEWLCFLNNNNWRQPLQKWALEPGDLLSSRNGLRCELAAPRQWNQLVTWTSASSFRVLNQITLYFIFAPFKAEHYRSCAFLTIYHRCSLTLTLSCLSSVCRTVAAEVRKQIAGQYGGSPQLFKNLNAGAATSNTVRILRGPVRILFSFVRCGWFHCHCSTLKLSVCTLG